MKRRCKKIKIILIPMVLLMGMAAVCFANDDNGAASINDTSASQIKKIPGTKYEPGYDFRQNAEKYYDFIGTVYDVQKEGIVVDDSYMKFAPKAKVSGARPGARVGIRFNDPGEVILCEPYKKSGR